MIQPPKNVQFYYQVVLYVDKNTEDVNYKISFKSYRKAVQKFEELSKYNEAVELLSVLETIIDKVNTKSEINLLADNL